MRQQAFNDQRRDSKSFVVVDDDCGVPTSVVENYQENNDSGPAGQFDPQSLSLSMSEYDKSQAYSVYSDYNEATRPEAGQDYTGFAAPAPFPDQYVGAQAQVPSGLPQSTVALGLAPSTQPYDTHDQSFYGQQQPQFAAYLDTSSPRRAPEIISYMPNEGPTGTKITVHFQSQYDFDNPQVNVFIMFDGKRCESVLSKRHPQNDMYQYTVSADSPPLLNTNSPLQIPLQLVLDSHSVIWETDTLEFGSFSYLDPPLYYQSTSPDAAPSRKRKLSLNVSPRHSPIKKNMPTVPGVQGQAYLTNTLPIGTPTSPFRRPSAPESFTQNRRFSGNDYQQAYPGAMNQQYFAGGPGSTTPSLRTTQSPSWGYHGGVQSANRSPSTASVSVSVSGKNAQLLPSPAASNPPLIRTSTIQTSPTTPNMAPSIAGFNPYTIYAANSKAQLEIDGELNSMADKWTTVEWESKRRLVQFRRSQSGSTITATFEPVTLEDRIPNSICISCIWWEEKQECYVTSVDTISLLESLVAVRFTVEEKNRIRRNLEGFRPATVSKVKADSEEFFKLIMGFPNPKPRNIEKDVKVFPWRILATALKKIIGKYSASYSSTAGALHAPAGSSYSTTGRASEMYVGIEQQAQRPGAMSPRSTASSVVGHHAHHAYAPMMNPIAYPHAASSMLSASLGLGPPAGSADMRMHVAASAAGATTSWNSAAATATAAAPLSSQRHYYTTTTTGRETWDPSSGHSPPATGLAGPPQAYQYSAHERFAPLRYAAGPSTEPARFVGLHDYEEPSHQTSTS